MEEQANTVISILPAGLPPIATSKKTTGRLIVVSKHRIRIKKTRKEGKKRRRAFPFSHRIA